MRRALQTLVDELIAVGDATAAAAIVGDGERVLAEARAGWRDRRRRRPLGRWDRFDLASLTKPWLATLALAVEQRLPLTTTLGEVWPRAPELWRDRSLECLLRHRSGLPPWRPLYRDVRDPARAVDRLLATEATAPVPTYGDPSFIVAARALATICGRPAESLLARRVGRPLGVGSVGIDGTERAVWSPLGNDREVELAAALGVAVARRGPAPRGVVQDGNARFLGGLAGHAGLFATSRAVWRLGAEWLRPGRLLDREQVERALDGPGRYRLGWWRRSAAPRATRSLSREAFGHHGFTGSSLWVDPSRGRVIGLLAHRARVDTDLDPWRERLHRIAATAG